ncbi:MAG TPA: 30S ribosomal protein S21, partial [Chloroflexi bacterium]|nr:30S ribosomal protein S21 [Chloroflexota bacterium]
MATVTLRPGESQEELLRRFRKEVTQARILSVCREKRWFVSKGELRRKQRKRALRKM